ncbi:hypothetical protein GGTG_13374 [Gaeumannomyces tritici R3-111a-1]|uniref:Uncharacterized protein n=1 Tax=Gaeumannomyces tritici (strain R3-111a-1) TaxID=644352 RepID=J3PIP5_GAET3|nr:hypothetical protein GGTG_13374 [Gaeumannomyces tritici R3-111a-1]EJT69106.1 hypothetical protein GGTG_13374 [Gaeumannomyces tritici R3-111a-1]
MRLYAKEIEAKLFSVHDYPSGSRGDASAASVEDQPPTAGNAATATATNATNATNANSAYHTVWKTADPEAATSTPEQVRETAALRKSQSTIKCYNCGIISTLCGGGTKAVIRFAMHVDYTGGLRVPLDLLR